MRSNAPLAVIVLLVFWLPEAASAGYYLRLRGSVPELAVVTCHRSYTGCELHGNPHPYDGPDLVPAVDASGLNLVNVQLEDGLLSGADFSFADFTYANLTDADMEGAGLRGANLYDANLNGVDLSNADLTGAEMFSVTITGGATMVNATLAGANLVNGVLRADLTNADLSNAILTRANLEGSNLSGADLRGADLSQAVLLGAIVGAPFYDSRTNFTNAWADYRMTPFDPVAAGWQLVPEPGAALLLGLGLAGLALGRRDAD